MHKPTRWSVTMLGLKNLPFLILLFQLAAGCSRVTYNKTIFQMSTLSQTEEHALYDDLIKYSDWRDEQYDENWQNYEDPVRGIIAYKQDDGPIWVAWITDSMGYGDSIIGIYDSEMNLQDVRIGGPIKSIRRSTPQKGIDALIVQEVSAYGTGLYGETMHILPIDDLKEPLWSGEIKYWEEGVKGRNEGLLLHAIVMLLDLDDDEKEELLVITSKQQGTYDDRNILYGDRDVECTIFSFDRYSRKFEPLNKIRSDILYPMRLKGKDRDID